MKQMYPSPARFYTAMCPFTVHICSTAEGCPLHGLYFSLRTTCANTSSGNYK